MPPSDPAHEAGIVLAHVVRQTFAREQPQPKRCLSKPVAMAIRCMLARHGNALTVAELAHEVGLSRFHFTRRFHREAGITPGAFLRRLRIARAMELLVESDRNVNRIAHDVGYEDHAAFTRAFNRITGTPPTHYRLTRTVLPSRDILAGAS